MLRIKWEPKNKLFSLNNRPRVYALATCIWKESNHIQIWPIELKLENIYLITDTRKCYRGKQALASHESSKEERLPFDPSSIYSWSIHGLLNRWTDIFILPRTPWGLTFNRNNGTKTQSIFVKLSENIFLGMSKVRAWLIFTLSMP